MSGNDSSPPSPHGHRGLRLAVVVGVVVLLAIMGTYWATESFAPTHTPTTVVQGQNRTIVVYHNSTIYQNTTVYQNTTHNVTTPVFHNSTVWQNSTAYENGTIYHNTTIYVNTTTVVLTPVVNVTGLSWVFDPSSSFVGKISATVVTPGGDGFVHSYPMGTVMWIVVNITNSAKSEGLLHVSLSSPFILVDSQPSVPRNIAAASTTTFELSIGIPYTPGEYTMTLDVSVT
jgi:hypothetical protein